MECQQVPLPIVLGLVLLLVAACAQSGNAQPTGPERVLVYVDCARCDFDYIRGEIPFVDYVRDPERANVHVFITSTRVGIQGRQYQVSFLGRDEFASTQFTFERDLKPSATSSEARDILTSAIRLGLSTFAARSSIGEGFDVTFPSSDSDDSTRAARRDPWRYWVFTLYGGDFELEKETRRTVFDSRWGFFADHVSEEWKVRFRPYFNYDLVTVERDEGPRIRSSITRHGIDSYLIRSLGSHWSGGMFVDYVTRNDRNLQHSVDILPAVEFSVLPYRLATRRAITVAYQVGLTYSDYRQETIFGKTSEWLPRHRLRAFVTIRQPWGAVYAGLEGAQYLHDTDKRRMETFSSVSLRVYEGLSVALEGQIDMVRDQLSLPAGDATLTEILLQQRELATDYDLAVSFAFTYTFGSKFANVVNTRF